MIVASAGRTDHRGRDVYLFWGFSDCSWYDQKLPVGQI